VSRHLTLIPIGSRGDVQPYVALGRALLHSGHKVRIATHDSFAGFVRESGLDFMSVGGDPQRIIDEQSPRLTSKNPLLAVPALLEILSQLVTPTLRGVALACKDTDAVVASYPALYSGIEAAEQARVPLLFASLHPAAPTEHAPHLLMPPLPRRLPGRVLRAYNRFSHFAGTELLFRLVRRPVDAARAAQLGWGPARVSPVHLVHARRIPILQSFSPTLVPVPPDWPDYVHVTGFWFLEPQTDYQPPPALASFIKSGPPPIYVGFGSFALQADDALRRVIDVLVRRRQRALVAASACSCPGGLPDHIVPVGALPHAWLFPQLRAAIHHGGIGTTHEILRAGIPMAVITHMIEQRFWGQAAHELGVAPPPVGARQLEPALLDAIVSRISDGSLKSAATAAAAAIRAERGVERAVAFIERFSKA
jgi:sterol 3beta-glucosyltransferase